MTEYVNDGNILWLAVAKFGTPPAWQPGINYRTGDIVVPRAPTIGQANLAFQAVGYVGSSGSPEPTWPTNTDMTVADGAVLWIARDSRASPAPLPANEYYQIDDQVVAE
jgi:hypothetical protein